MQLPLLSSSSLPFCFLWRLFICGGRCCGLQMLDPAVRLLGHTDLQLFAWTCCFASKQTLKGSCSFFHPPACWVFSFTLFPLSEEMGPHGIWWRTELYSINHRLGAVYLQLKWKSFSLLRPLLSVQYMFQCRSEEMWVFDLRMDMCGYAVGKKRWRHTVSLAPCNWASICRRGVEQRGHTHAQTQKQRATSDATDQNNHYMLNYKPVCAVSGTSVHIRHIKVIIISWELGKKGHICAVLNCSY